MVPTSAPPPYRRIANALSRQIATGELRPGDRLPSTRDLTRIWGVAMATATKALAVLRTDGLVEARPGVGTIVSAGSAGSAGPIGPTRAAGPIGPASTAEPSDPPQLGGEHASSSAVTTRHRPSGRPAGTLDREEVVRAAIAIADAHGLDALSMRRVAADLGVGPMSLYHYVANKDELLEQMLDTVLGDRPLPDPGPPDWRTALELAARHLWELVGRHQWLATALSFTRPRLVPNALSYTEWMIGALEPLGLSGEELLHEAILLPAYVLSVSRSAASEREAERQTGMTAEQWWEHQDDRVEAVLGSGRYPRLRRLITGPDDLDRLFEYGLRRHLDGLAARVDARDNTRDNTQNETRVDGQR